MRVFVLRVVSSGAFLKGVLSVCTEEMSTTPRPTGLPHQMTLDQLTVVGASFSSLLFFVVIVGLLSIICRRDPHCCKLRSYQEPHADMGAPPQYSSRQTLVGSPHLAQMNHVSHDMNDNNTEAGQLFFVGLPSSYSLPTVATPLPRLPSYESVRKKDRQRQIHMMIADRFGLNGPIVTEPPPTYEESIRQSVELPHNILSSGVAISPPQSTNNTDTAPNIQADSPHPVNCDRSSTVLPV
uniref:uncharacterized protein LOC109958892 isoform X2 n=1 Tax=Monopterus albus TaxID=43700 RepID=UPI0009B3FC8F|nr:uncharacterized protein LOC109958892 isoform X2 [Monopterus albus]